MGMVKKNYMNLEVAGSSPAAIATIMVNKLEIKNTFQNFYYSMWHFACNSTFQLSLTKNNLPHEKVVYVNVCSCD